MRTHNDPPRWMAYAHASDTVGKAMLHMFDGGRTPMSEPEAEAVQELCYWFVPLYVDTQLHEEGRDRNRLTARELVSSIAIYIKHPDFGQKIATGVMHILTSRDRPIKERLVFAKNELFATHIRLPLDYVELSERFI